MYILGVEKDKSALLWEIESINGFLTVLEADSENGRLFVGGSDITNERAFAGIIYEDGAFISDTLMNSFIKEYA